MATYLKSTAYTRMFKMIDSTDHISKKTGLTCTVNLSKAGATFGAAGGTVTEVANGWYKVVLTTTDTNTAGDLAYYITATGADDTDFSDQVVDPAAANLGVNVVNINSVAAATPGASGGLLISGSNAGTTTLAALTVTGSLTVSDGLLVARSTSNASAITATGNGTGHGIVATSGSGATGDGVQMTAASTNGRGLKLLGTGSGEALLGNAGATGNGITIAAGGTSGDAVNLGATSGNGMTVAGGTNGNGFATTGVGTGHGLKATGGTSGGASSMFLNGGNAGLNIQPTNGDAIAAAGGSGGGRGMALTGNTTGAGLKATGGATSGNGFESTGTAGGNGVNFTGGATGGGWSISGGATSGDAISVATTSGHGVNIAATGASKHGVTITGGTSGTSDGLKCVAGTGGVDIRGNITGNLVGTVSTLTTYTGNTVQTGDSFARLGAAGAGLTALGDTRIANLDATISSRTKPADTQAAVTLVTTTTNLTNAPTAGDLTATMKTSIGTAVAASAVASVTGNVGGNVVGTVASVVGAVGSVTGNVGGNLVGTLSTTERTAIADALLNRDMSVGTDSGSTTVRTVRQALRFLRNKWSISAGTLTVTKEDDSTASWTGTVTTTAGNPVSTIDPA